MGKPNSTAAASIAGRRVDRLRLRALLEQPEGFLEIGDEDAVDQEPLAVAHEDGRLAECLGKRQRRGDGRG